MFCKSCGKKNYDHAVLCAHCGVPTGVSVQNAGIKRRSDDVMSAKLIALSLFVPFAGIVIGRKRIAEGFSASGSTCIRLSILSWHILVALIGLLIVMAYWLNEPEYYVESWMGVYR